MQQKQKGADIAMPDIQSRSILNTFSRVANWPFSAPAVTNFVSTSVRENYHRADYDPLPFSRGRGVLFYLEYLGIWDSYFVC
jgi:hypothetical protein